MQRTLIALSLSLVFASSSWGCAVSTETQDVDGTDQEAAEDVGQTSSALTASFKSTCTLAWGPVLNQVVGPNYYMAGAWRCKRRNGSWDYDPGGFAGYCTGDISNCNGKIVCQSSCP